MLTFEPIDCSKSQLRNYRYTLCENLEDGKSDFDPLFLGIPVALFSHVILSRKFATLLMLDIGMQPATLEFQAAAVKLIFGVSLQYDQ